MERFAFDCKIKRTTSNVYKKCSAEIAQSVGRLQRQDFFSPPVSRSALGPTEPPIRWTPVVMRPEREADHSPLLLRSRKCGALPPLPYTSSQRVLAHRDNFMFQSAVTPGIQGCSKQPHCDFMQFLGNLR